MPDQLFYMRLTEAGLAAYARAGTPGGPPVSYAFAAVGDGGGQAVAPDTGWTALTNEVWRGAPVYIEVDEKNPTHVIVEMYVPHNVGGWTVREVGLLDAAGVLLAAGSYPASDKPDPAKGASLEMRARFTIEHTNAAQTTLKIDPSIVMASREYAEKVGKIQIAAHNIDPEAHENRFADIFDKFVPKTRKIATTAPLTGGGTLDRDITLALASPLPIVNGGTGLAAAPSMLTNLASTTAASPLQASPRPGVTGTLPIGRGGTGATTVTQAKANLVYELCEFYFFRHPTLKPGFQAAQGGLLANAATLYPEAWAYLQTTAGKLLCKTEAEWQALTKVTWATLADGTKVGWNGIGGAPFYAPNTATGALRLPDLRGMYAEAAGYDSLGVGGAHGDRSRRILGQVGQIDGGVSFGSGDLTHRLRLSGAFAEDTVNRQFSGFFTQTTNASRDLIFDSARVGPVGAATSPRAWGALPCVYLGPKS